MKREEFANEIYDLVWGNLDTEHYPTPESYVVQDEFTPGSYCAKAYEDPRKTPQSV